MALIIIVMNKSMKDLMRTVMLLLIVMTPAHLTLTMILTLIPFAQMKIIVHLMLILINQILMVTV